MFYYYNCIETAYVILLASLAILRNLIHDVTERHSTEMRKASQESFLCIKLINCVNELICVIQISRPVGFPILI
jgi:hypothetical protein